MPPGPRIAPPPRQDRPNIASHVKTVGVRRSNWGAAGRPISVWTNHFEVKAPKEYIHHYDTIMPAEKTLPIKLNFDIIEQLQKAVPNIFNPKAVYDGRKNMFASRPLKLSGKDAKNHAYEQFTVSLPDSNPQAGKGPRSYTVKIAKVAEINPEVLNGFLLGRQSHDNTVLTTITAMNVAIRMLPMTKYPFNVRSFFTDREKKDIGNGLVLWRGYFQSIRPGGTKMWINIDISTGTMYKDMPLINFCLEHLNYNDPKQLSKNTGFNDRERSRLQRFVAGVRVSTPYSPNPRAIKKVTLEPAATQYFQTREGEKMSVQKYFEKTHRLRLEHPSLPCVEVGAGALIPLELCRVVPGQLMRKQVPADKTRDVLAFSTLKPNDRLNSIRNGVKVFEYDKSEYMAAFGMRVNAATPLTVPARVLQPPTLQYGQASRTKNIRPENGAWNMREKTFFRVGSTTGWVLAVFERQNRFTEPTARTMGQLLQKAATEVGILGFDKEPLIVHAQDPRKSPIDFLREVGLRFNATRNNTNPNLFVCVLPEGAAGTYTAIKHFGDCVAGVATQCMKANKCGRGSAQYFANVCLKINVKLGGINCVPLAQDVPSLFSSESTIIFGADVIHPAPGSGNRPSFTSLVGTLDKEQSKYIARVAVQESRVEMISDLQSMAGEILGLFRQYRTKVEKLGGPPKRVIFYRDGVSEGQFQQVLDIEARCLKDAFRAMGLAEENMPKFTIIVVGKRHHVRFFPIKADRDSSDQSGNCKAGTVVDREITHPTDLDFYLQSHGGLLGTSRPAHYSVLLDENNFSADAIQQMSFALCHVYARSTRSVSIPAPVYYADIVCARAKNHFDPRGNLELESPEVGTGGTRVPSITAYKNAFVPVKGTQATSMYFS